MANLFTPTFYQNHEQPELLPSRTVTRQEYIYADRDKFVTTDDPDTTDNERTITCDSKAKGLRILAHVDAVDFEGQIYAMGDHIELDPGQFKQWYNIRHHNLPERTLPLDNLKGNDATVTIPSQTLPLENAVYDEAKITIPETSLEITGIEFEEGPQEVVIPATNLGIRGTANQASGFANTSNTSGVTLQSQAALVEDAISGHITIDGTEYPLEDGRIAKPTEIRTTAWSNQVWAPVEARVNVGWAELPEMTVQVNSLDIENPNAIFPETDIPVNGLDLSEADITIPEQTYDVDGIDVENGTVTIPELPVVPIIDVPQFQIKYECEETAEGEYQIKVISDHPVYLSNITFVDSIYNPENSWFNPDVEDSLDGRAIIEPLS